MKHDSIPMPNCPISVERADSIVSARFVDPPTFDNAERICSSVKPIPLSVTVSTPAFGSGSNNTLPGCSSSSDRRAVMASTPFCSSSRTNTSRELYRCLASTSITPLRSTWNRSV